MGFKIHRLRVRKELKWNCLLTLEGIPRMVASIHRYYHRSLPCRHVSCSAGAVFGPICVIYLDSTLFTERGEIMNLKKTKNGFLGQGCDTRITETCMSGKLLANALVGHALAVNWFTEILYELFTLTSTKSKKKSTKWNICLNLDLAVSKKKNRLSLYCH